MSFKTYLILTFRYGCYPHSLLGLNFFFIKLRFSSPTYSIILLFVLDSALFFVNFISLSPLLDLLPLSLPLLFLFPFSHFCVHYPFSSPFLLISLSHTILFTIFKSASFLQVYDPKTNEWRYIAPMSTRRSSVGVGVLGGLLYAVGGYDGASRHCLSSVECYNPVTKEWGLVCEMSTRRSGAGVGVSKLYYIISNQ